MESQLKSANILGVRVDMVNMSQTLDLVVSWIERGEGKYYIVTPNPEFIMLAEVDKEFKKVLNSSNLSIPDSARFGWATNVLGQKNWFGKFLLAPLFFLPSRFFLNDVIHFDTLPGVDLMERLCFIASKKGFTVGFLGGKKGIAKKAAECLTKKYLNLKISLAEDGPLVDSEGNELRIKNHELRGEEKVDNYMMHSSLFINPVDILFVAFGQGKQEKWIANNLEKLPVKVAMGVGGSFDYLGGQVPRAPFIIRNLGLEWLFRLIIQPWRVKRQLELVKFVWKVVKYGV